MTRPPVTSRKLVAAIRSLARRHQKIAHSKASAEFIIAALRQRGQHEHADELERLVSRIRAQRALQAEEPLRATGTKDRR